MTAEAQRNQSTAQESEGKLELRMTNRDDMAFAVFDARRRAGEWKDGDLFALFRSEYGALRVQQGHVSDFYEHTVDSVLHVDIEQRGAKVSQQDIVFLIGILMVSRVHPYKFVDFIHLVNHNGQQLFDLAELCSWIAKNDGRLFMTDTEAAVEMDAADPAALEQGWRELQESADAEDAAA